MLLVLGDVHSAKYGVLEFRQSVDYIDYPVFADEVKGLGLHRCSCGSDLGEWLIVPDDLGCAEMASITAVCDQCHAVNIDSAGDVPIVVGIGFNLKVMVDCLDHLFCGPSFVEHDVVMLAWFAVDFVPQDHCGGCCHDHLLLVLSDFLILSCGNREGTG